jgi:hypothetical protein
VTLVLERKLDFEIDEKGYEAVAAVVRSRLGVEVAQVGRTLSTRGDVFSLKHEGDATVIRVRGEWRNPRKT